MSWTMVCEGEEKMSGEGEIVQKPDGYDGKMTMRSAQGEMLMKLARQEARRRRATPAR